MSWYDDITDAEIENLKENYIRLDLLDVINPITGQNMRKIPCGLVKHWISGDGWQKSFAAGLSLLQNMTYRLRTDWKRPEPQWYDDMSIYELLTLQKNEISLGLLDAKYSVTGQNMRKIPYGLIQYWNSAGCSWEKSFSNGSALLPDITYKLNPDWCRMGDGDGK
jgi:hypothetical protein